ncbi:hypothetical protein GEOBRER4_n0865 [Citrifermentans bremense]|uniref:Uncharacterized protein n=1 Tax=Citrifermentans bremense TaxID=60035 RepID=A0A7R7FRX4_9BACT|nr:hypothetical protein GEOBRER4_n0865 [Citrifermentans bremense]
MKGIQGITARNKNLLFNRKLLSGLILFIRFKSLCWYGFVSPL